MGVGCWVLEVGIFPFPGPKGRKNSWLIALGENPTPARSVQAGFRARGRDF